MKDHAFEVAIIGTGLAAEMASHRILSLFNESNSVIINEGISEIPIRNFHIHEVDVLKFPESGQQKRRERRKSERKKNR